jgi:hypothetical protein
MARRAADAALPRPDPLPQATVNPKRTVYDVKRLIGRKWVHGAAPPRKCRHLAASLRPLLRCQPTARCQPGSHALSRSRKPRAPGLLQLLWAPAPRWSPSIPRSPSPPSQLPNLSHTPTPTLPPLSHHTPTPNTPTPPQV